MIFLRPFNQMSGQHLEVVEMIGTILFRSVYLSLSYLKQKLISKTIILSVLFVHETLSLTLRAEHQLQIFKNVFRRICGSERGSNMTEKICNEELYNF
jgi:hypothetical protein